LMRKTPDPLMKTRLRQKARPSSGSAGAISLALRDGGLLAAIFLAPLLWGRFDALGGAVVLSCLSLGGIGFLFSKPSGWFPRGLPLSSFHLALAGLLIVSFISYFFSLSRFATAVDLVRLAAGAMAFWLALWSKARPGGPEVRGVASRRSGSGVERAPQAPLTAALFVLLVAAGLGAHDWSFHYLESAQNAPGHHYPLFQALWLLLLAWHRVIVLLVGIFAAVALISLRLWRRPASAGPLEVALASSGLVACYGIYEWLFMRFVVGNTSWQTFSTFLNPNPLAGFLGIALFLALGSLGRITDRGGRAERGCIFPAFVCLLILVCLIPTYSKGAWASIYLAGAVFLILLALILIASRKKKILLIALVLFLVFAAPAGVLLARPSLRAKASAAFSLQNRSNMFRYLTWKGALRMAEDHPLIGVGAGAFEYGFGRYAIAGYTRRAHQNYLETAAETGWPGLVSLVCLLGAGIIGIGRALKHAQSRPQKILAAGALSALLVMVFHSLLDYDWYIGANLVFFFLACALGFSAGDSASPADARKAPMKSAWRIALAALLILLAGKALTLGWADREFRAHQDLLSGNQFWGAREDLQKAVKLAPEYGRARWKLAALLPPQEGIPLVKTAISLEPEYSPYWATLGRLREEGGDLKGALEAYGKATALNRQQLSAWIAQARVNLRLGRPERAAGAFQEITEVERGLAGRYQGIDYEVKTEYAEAHYGLAVAALKGFVKGNQERAVGDLRQALRIIEDFKRTGKEFERQRRAIGEAEPGTEEAMDLLEAKCNFRMAGILQSEGRQGEAAKMLASAVKLYPKVAEEIAAEDMVWRK